MKKSAILLALSMLLTAATPIAAISANLSGPVVIDEIPANFDVFLAIGQSNMSGRDTVAEQDMRVLGNNNTFLLNAQGEWEYAQPGIARPDRGYEGLNRYSDVEQDILMAKGLSPAFYFADTMGQALAGQGRNVGVICNARGATALLQWRKGYDGSVANRPDFNLFENTVARVNAALSMGGALRGVIWHQGESDSANVDYVSQLGDFIDELYGALDIQPNSVPFIAGELASSHAGSLGFNYRLAGISSIPNAGRIALGRRFATLDDGVHFTASSQRAMGKLYAQKMLQMAYGESVEVDISGDVSNEAWDMITLPDTAFAAKNSLNNFLPKDVNDGLTSDMTTEDDKNNRWVGYIAPEDSSAVAYRGPNWLQIYLGSSRYVHQLDIYFRNQNTTRDTTWQSQKYKIQASTAVNPADSDFTDITEERYATAERNRDEVAISRAALYIRIVITDSPKLATDSQPLVDGNVKLVCIEEIALFGDNGIEEIVKLSLDDGKIYDYKGGVNNNKTLINDGNYNGENGKTYFRWASETATAASPAWVKMDLGALKYVNYANIYFRANWRPHDYRIQYATTAEGLDGDYYDLTAETLQSSSSNANQLMPETLGINRHIRWLKILCYRSASAAPGNVSIHEVELFGRGAPEPAEILISETPRYYAGGGYDTTAITVTQAGKHAFFQNGEALFDMAAGYVESKATVINNKTEAGNQNLWYVFAAYGGDGNALTDIKLVPCSLRPGETKELSAGLNVSSSSGAMKAFVLEEGTLAPLLEKISLP